MITIDGSQGEGGGQILRSALALSIVTGKPFRINKIRANRAKPGLLKQHLTATLAAAEICGGELTGASLGSQQLKFIPQQVQAGDYHFQVGTAGSAMLVLQTVLPPLLTAPGPTTLVLEGGTHNTHAPPFDFIARAYLPLVARMGPKVTAVLDRYGFYPVGGGQARVSIEPAKTLTPLELNQRGALRHQHATAVAINLPTHIGQRELTIVAEQLGWPADALHLCHDTSGPGRGNVLMLEVASENVTEVFTGFGQRGVTAETVAQQTTAEARRYLASNVPVGEHLADQLMLLCALAGGGSYTTLPLTPHSTTNRETIERFLEVRVTAREMPDDACRVEVSPC